MDNFDENKEPIAQTGENQTPYEEEKKVDVKEALTFMFKNGNAKKFLGGVLGYALLLVAIKLLFSSKIYFGAFLYRILGLVLILLAIILLIIISGYVLIYQHDRALDKEAKLRNYGGNIINSLLVSFKNGVAGSVVMNFLAFPLFIIGSIAFALLYLLFNYAGIIGKIAAPIIGICFYGALIVCFVIFFYSLYSYVSKNLKFESWFKLDEIYKFTRGVHYGFPAVITIIGLSLFNILLFGLSLLFTFLIKNPIFTVPVRVLCVIFYIYVMFCCANIIGQYSYNAIEKNMKVKPETLPKEINEDKVAINFVIFYFIFMLLYLGAIFILPSLMNFNKYSKYEKQLERQRYYSPTGQTMPYESLPANNDNGSY